ncbi:MAG: TetR/AcrR family transcriptional regulator [Proteobacteria bacterium]|nr:TetR/AcrR family transcriptional regulator [Pseudomonadota bacterium]
MADPEPGSRMKPLDVTRKGAKRISEIVDAGAELLLTGGFSSLTKRRIAKRLGISHGNVSYYFPTRDSLWNAVIDFELQKYYQQQQRKFYADPADPQACFDEFVVRWMDEYDDPVIRVFFSHIIAFAEINESMAKIRNEAYESFFDTSMTLARALKQDVEEEELEGRVLEVMVVLEGLQAISAFRPALLERNHEFKQRLLRRVNKIIHGE